MQRLKFLWMYANYLCTIEWFCVYLMMCCVNVQCNAMPCSALSTVPSGPPREVRAVPGGAGSVRVTWTHPPGGASGYVIFYSPSSPMADHTLSVQVDDPEATSHTIQSMMTQTEYTIQMLAYAELSTALSDSTTVYLTDYVVRVLAFNSIGRGKFSQPPVTVYTKEKGVCDLFWDMVQA